jgi:hypothetical protein
LYLTGARRYSQSGKVNVEIPGDCFIVPYCKVVDLNLTYNIKIGKPLTQTFHQIVSFIGLLGLIALCVVPWIFQVSILHKIFSMLTGLLGWTSLMAALIAPFDKGEKKLKLNGILICAVVGIASLAISAMLLKII